VLDWAGGAVLVDSTVVNGVVEAITVEVAIFVELGTTTVEVEGIAVELPICLLASSIRLVAIAALSWWTAFIAVLSSGYTPGLYLLETCSWRILCNETSETLSSNF